MSESEGDSGSMCWSAKSRDAKMNEDKDEQQSLLPPRANHKIKSIQ